MPPPTSVSDLINRLRKSKLVPADRLEAFLSALPPSDQPSAPDAMLDRLVTAGLITRFHADKLSTGKYKGFWLADERYLILDALGQGGMGQVFLAEHAQMRRLVALKVLSPQAFDNDVVARERFFREARAAGVLDHPNIVRIYDLCQDGKILFLVMEYVEGLSLQALVTEHGPLDVATACNYTRQVTFGLQHAHAMGFVHRDIKPANLLLERTGLIKILDLGLVRSEEDAARGLTKQLDNKSILGTADYVAPEQAIDSSKVDVRADIYSLGATLYFLLAGRPMFPEGKTAQKLMWQQLKEPPPINRLRPEVPAELAAVVHKMLQKKPDDRYSTVEEVFEALAAFDSEDVPPPDPSWIPDPPARVALARGAAPTPVSRSPGSTSQIVISALRTGSSASGLPKPRGSDSDAVKEKTRAARIEVTARANEDDTPSDYDDLPEAEPEPQSVPAEKPERPANSNALPVALSIALVLALLGIVILLLTK